MYTSGSLVNIDGSVRMQKSGKVREFDEDSRAVTLDSMGQGNGVPGDHPG